MIESFDGQICHRLDRNDVHRSDLSGDQSFVPFLSNSMDKMQEKYLFDSSIIIELDDGNSILHRIRPMFCRRFRLKFRRAGRFALLQIVLIGIAAAVRLVVAFAGRLRPSLRRFLLGDRRPTPVNVVFDRFDIHRTLSHDVEEELIDEQIGEMR